MPIGGARSRVVTDKANEYWIEGARGDAIRSWVVRLAFGKVLFGNLKIP